MENKFYSKFTTLFVIASATYIVFMFILAAKDYYGGEPMDKIIFVFSFSVASGVIVVPVLTWILLRVFPVYVKEDGLRSFNVYGAYKDIQWKNIYTIKPINILGLKYIRIHSRAGGLPIWIPVWLKDADGFISAVGHNSGDESLLQEYFNQSA